MFLQLQLGEVHFPDSSLQADIVFSCLGKTEVTRALVKSTKPCLARRNSFNLCRALRVVSVDMTMQ